MDNVQKAVQQGEYALGLTLFRAIQQPTSLESRWAGICLMHEGQKLEAGVQLRRAIAGGDIAAGIYLSALHLMDRELTEALNALDQVDPATLPSSQAALWYRERARVGWLLGEHRSQLLKLGQHAWQLAGESQIGTQVSVATLMGNLLGHFGEHERALAYLNFAAENGHPRQQEYVALCRAISLTALSRFEEAAQQLGSIQTPAITRLRDLERVALLAAQQDWTGASLLLLELLPSTVGQPSLELRTRTALLLLAVAQQDDAQAQRHLLRAEQLAHEPYDRLLLDHRVGQWLSRQGNPAGLIRLRRAAKGLEEAGHFARAVVVRLALAEAQPKQRTQHLQHAASLAAKLGTPPLLTSEWPLLPQTHKHLIALPESTFERLLLLGEVSAPKLRLLTLGQTELVASAGRISFRMGRVIEILCYMRRQGTVSLWEVQRDLFPDVPTPRARNYFHQVRVDIAARIPGLEIHFDQGQKLYRLQGRATLAWDVEELEQALQRGEWPQNAPSSVEFLPKSESEWAIKEREQLSRWVTQVGLETMEDWFQSGQYDKCIYLAERLLPIDPLDEGLHSFLLNATYRIKGYLVARHLYHESAATFMREVGEIPEALQRLDKQWQEIN